MDDNNFEFDHVFQVNTDGSISHPDGIYAPSVYHSETDDIEIESTDWEALTGYSNQYNYNGPVLHASEQFDSGLRVDVLSEPGIYVLVPVEVMPDDEDSDPFPAGWAVLKYTKE